MDRSWVVTERRWWRWRRNVHDADQGLQDGSSTSGMTPEAISCGAAFGCSGNPTMTDLVRRR
jgi:hypothetical protein